MSRGNHYRRMDRNEVHWTPRLLAALRAGWTAGVPILKLAADLSRRFRQPITKGALTGKVHRLGLTSRHNPIIRAPLPVTGAAAGRAPLPVTGAAAGRAPLPFGAGLRLDPAIPPTGECGFGRPSAFCCWPLEGIGREMRFCGALVKHGRRLSYCDKHLAWSRYGEPKKPTPGTADQAAAPVAAVASANGPKTYHPEYASRGEPWSDEMLEALRQLAPQGSRSAVARRISERFGRPISKGAVSGQLRRLGLEKRRESDETIGTAAPRGGAAETVVADGQPDPADARRIVPAVLCEA